MGTRTSSEGRLCIGHSPCRPSSVEWQRANAVPGSRGASPHLQGSTKCPVFASQNLLFVGSGPQDAIMNQYYEAEARKNVFSQPTAQDVIMNLYYEVEARKDSLSPLPSAPTKAEDSVVVSSSSPAFPEQYLNLPQKRSSSAAVSAPLQSDCRASGSTISATAPFRPLRRAGRQTQPSWQLPGTSAAGCWNGRATSASKPRAQR